MKTISIRGAITADNNTIEAITNATIELYNEILSKNDFSNEDIVNIIFSLTKDLNAIYPAKILRENFDITNTPLFCTQEADILGSLPKCIRILVTINSNLSKEDVKHVYLKEAQKLRPDLIN